MKSNRVYTDSVLRRTSHPHEKRETKAERTTLPFRLSVRRLRSRTTRSDFQVAKFANATAEQWGEIFFTSLRNEPIRCGNTIPALITRHAGGAK